MNCELSNIADGSLSEIRERSHITAMKPMAPCVNCREKIIFIMDSSAEMSEISFRNSSRSQELSTWAWTKKALEMFIVTKSTLNPKHEYAIVIVQDDVVLWLQEFTNNINVIKDALVYVEGSGAADVKLQFSLDPVFSVLNDNFELPDVGNLSMPPDFIYRAIFIYGRSTGSIALSESGHQLYSKFHCSPYFFFDVLYLHKPAADDNDAKAIFDWLCDFDRMMTGYVVEASTNPARIFEELAKLIAHPLQRSVQSKVQYSLQPRQESAEAV